MTHLMHRIRSWERIYVTHSIRPATLTIEDSIILDAQVQRVLDAARASYDPKKRTVLRTFHAPERSEIRAVGDYMECR